MNALLPGPDAGQSAAGLLPLTEPSAAPTGFDAHLMLRALLRGLPVIAACLLLGLGLGVLALRSLPPQYTSSVSILIDPKDPAAYGAAGEFAGLTIDERKIADVEQILLSSQLLERVVRAEALQDSPQFGAQPDSLLHRLSGYLRTGHAVPLLNTNSARLQRAVAQLARMVRVSREGMTYVMTVSVIAPSAQQAQALAAGIADTYIADQVDAKYAAVRNDAAWLQTRLAQAREQLTASEAKVESIRRQYGLVQTAGAAGATLDRQRMGELNAELARAEAEVAITGARYNEATHAQSSGGGIGTLADFSGSKLIESLRDQQAEARQKLADLSVRYAANHPLRQAAEQSLRSLDRQTDAALGSVASGLRSEYQAALARSAALQAELKSLVGRESDTGSTEGRVALREAERMAQVNQTVYEATLNHLRDVEQQETRQEPEARIISEAQVPEIPSSPRPMICLALGAVLGLIVGAGIVVLRLLLQPQVLDAEQAERSLALPVLSIVPELRARDLKSASIPEFLLQQPFSTYAESLRRLRLGLRMALPAGPAVLHVTSAIPHEGKSTIAASLAVAYAQLGLQTVLVDLDVHRPAAEKPVAALGPQGVTDILSGTATLDAALSQHPHLPLAYVPAGDPAQYRPELLESPALKRFLKELSAHFDMVVLDTAPVLPVADAQIVAPLADAVLLVISWRTTLRSHVERAVSLLRACNAPLAGSALNRAELGKTEGYGYGYLSPSENRAPAIVGS